MHKYYAWQVDSEGRTLSIRPSVPGGSDQFEAVQRYARNHSAKNSPRFAAYLVRHLPMVPSQIDKISAYDPTLIPELDHDWWLFDKNLQLIVNDGPPVTL